MWNIIRDRVPVHPRDAVVLYLAGEQDLDRPIALSKGFSSHNLIAVEREPDILELLRSRGVLTVFGELEPVIGSWPESVGISCVFGDFMCGLTVGVENCAMAATASPAVLKNAQLVFNMLRGRERDNQWTWAERIAREAGMNSNGPHCMHRGKQLVATFLVESATALTKKETPSIEELAVALDKIYAIFKPTFSSYPSGPQWFDSVAMRKPFAGGARPEEPNIKIKAQIAAVLAHRTRRMKEAA